MNNKIIMNNKITVKQSGNIVMFKMCVDGTLRTGLPIYKGLPKPLMMQRYVVINNLGCVLPKVTAKITTDGCFWLKNGSSDSKILCDCTITGTYICED